MKQEEIRDGLMVSWGENTLGGIVGRPFEENGAPAIHVRPANTGNPDVQPGEMTLALDDVTPADMDRWMYLVEGNHWVAKKPGVVIAADAA